MSKIDITKPVETLDGEAVTLVLTDGRGVFPLAGYRGDRTYLSLWTADGQIALSSPHPALDLRNVQPKPVESTVYVNVYKTLDREQLYVGAGYATREGADNGAHSRRVGCKRLILLEGEYDE